MNLTEDNRFIRKLITGKFTESKELIAAKQEVKNKMRTATRRLKTFETKYSFLNDIIRIGIKDNELAIAIKLLLKNAGFNRVVNYKDKRQKPKREDMQAESDNDVFIIEVKGVKTTTPSRNDMFQIMPYFNRSKTRYPNKNVYGLTIISHDNANFIGNRTHTFYDFNTHEDLKSSDLSLISAIDLLLHFRNLKSGKIDFDTFKERIKKTGILTYSSNGGKTLER